MLAHAHTYAAMNTDGFGDANAKELKMGETTAFGIIEMLSFAFSMRLKPYAGRMDGDG